MNTPDGGFITGIKVAATSKLLENHPHLQTGAIAGLLVAEAERALSQSTTSITGTMHSIAASQSNENRTRHQELMEQSIQLSDLTDSLVESTHAAQCAEEARGIYASFQSVVNASPDYQKSFEVISDAELYALLQGIFQSHPGDFSRADHSDPRELWKYRAAMTLAFGSDYDYGIDRLPLHDIDFDLENCDVPDALVKPKTTVLNLLRRQYLQALATQSA